MVTTKRMTVEEFAALPDDGWRHELIRGELVRMAPGGLEHGGIGQRLARWLGDHVDTHDLGLVVVDAAFVFEEDPPTVRVPDMAFIRRDRLPPRAEWSRLSRVLADLAVEIVSPNDRPSEVAEKVAFYLEHGVPLVWVVYPRPRRVVAHRPGRPPRTFGADDTLDGEEIVPGFRLPVADIFV